MTRRFGRPYGAHGYRVSLWLLDGRIVALWRERGKRKKRSWPDTKVNRAEAKAWAERFADLRRTEQPSAPLTTAELWERYAESEFPSLRARSQVLYREYWRRWEVFAAAESVAEDLGPETMARHRGAMERDGLASSTIGQALRTVKMVYAWGFRHRVLARNDVRDYRYKVAKDRRPVPPAEYRADDLTAILRHLPLARSATWRAHAVLVLCGYQGVRQNAVLHLRWEDVDLKAGLVLWRAAWDKTGVGWTQPLRKAALDVLRAVQTRDERSPWVFPSGSAKNRHEVYSAQSLWAALRRAEEAAGIPHLPRRAAHGLRRMVFNDVLGVTGDIGAAMASTNHTDLRSASRYVRGRADVVRNAFTALDEKATETAPVAPAESVSPLVPSAPRRNRTFNLAEHTDPPDTQKPGNSTAYGPETAPEDTRNPPESPNQKTPERHSEEER